MNIIIQGSQGQGKTRTANHIASMYPADSVIQLENWEAAHKRKIEMHCRQVLQNNGQTPLVVLDDLTAEEMTEALTFRRYLKYLLTAQIDFIFITQGHLNISKK